MVEQGEVGLDRGLRDQAVEAGSDRYALPAAVQMDARGCLVASQRLLERDESLPAEVVPQSVKRRRIARAAQDLEVDRVGDDDGEGIAQKVPQELWTTEEWQSPRS